MASIDPADDTIIVSSYSLRSLATGTSQIDDSDIDPALLDPTLTLSVIQPTLSQSESNVPIRSIEPSQPQTKRTELRWTLIMHETLLTTMLDQCRGGKRADSGFKKEAWNICRDAVQNVYEGVPILEDKQIKSKLDWFKSMWKEWSSIDENSGLGWDEPSQLHTAPDDVWRRYLEVSTMLLLVQKRN
jgi:hypothetical protein